MNKILIPVEDEAHFNQLASTLEKMGFPYKAKGPTLQPDAIQVEYAHPLDLFYLGATVVADSNGLFKSGLTR